MTTNSLTTGLQSADAAANASAPALWQRSSFQITVLTLSLAAFGLVMVCSAAASREFTDVAAKRLAVTGVGLWAFLFGTRVDYQWWRRHSLGLLTATSALLVLVLVPGVADARNGARRWISFGLPVGFQPSEFAKLALCIWVAAYCERNLSRLKRPVAGFLAPLAVIGAVCGLVLLAPDFGTAVLLGTGCAAIVWVMGSRLVYFLLAGVAAAPFLQRLVLGVPYRLRRVLSFLDPWADPRGAGYQLIQSKIAIGSGGIFGTGLGMGQQEEGFLPAAENDFIFSVIAEELGFIGATVVIGAFVYLLVLGLRVALKGRDPFAFGLAFGLTVLMGLQAALHVAVVTGAVPTKGLSLPFISAGGSSLIVSMLAAGMLVNIARSEEHPAGHPLTPWPDDVPAYERHVNRALEAFRNRLRRIPEPRDATE